MEAATARAPGRAHAPARSGSRRRAGRSGGRRYRGWRARSRRAGRSRGRTPAAGIAMLPVTVGRTAGGAVGDLADSGIVVRMARSRAWIAVVAALLAGIVALNVYGLNLSSRVSDTAAQADRIERENSLLRERISKRTTKRRDGAAIKAPAIPEADVAAAEAPAAAAVPAGEETAAVPDPAAADGEATAAPAPDAASEPTGAPAPDAGGGAGPQSGGGHAAKPAGGIGSP